MVAGRTTARDRDTIATATPTHLPPQLVLLGDVVVVVVGNANNKAYVYGRMYGDGGDDPVVVVVVVGVE